MKQQWKVNIASEGDFERWLNFVKKVQHEFHGLDLYSDEKYKSAILKNINRGTAIYVEDNESSEIIGAMIYSPKSNHIGWIAVNTKHRRQGIGSALVNYMFKKLPKDVPIKVKTFLETDEPGQTAHCFYKSLGFQPKEILDDVNNENAGKPFYLFIKE